MKKSLLALSAVIISILLISCPQPSSDGAPKTVTVSINLLQSNPTGKTAVFVVTMDGASFLHKTTNPEAYTDFINKNSESLPKGTTIAGDKNARNKLILTIKITAPQVISATWDVAGLVDKTTIKAGDKMPEKLEIAHLNVIFNEDDLQKIKDYPTADFVLAADIDLTGVTHIPIGRTTPYSGTFDGNGKTIRNLEIGSGTSSAGDYTGLFGKTDGAAIKNLIIDHAGIWGKQYVGALVGLAENTNIAGVSMKSTENAPVSGKDSSAQTGEVNKRGPPKPGDTSSVGGLVGKASKSTVSGYATGDVQGTKNYVGGLVGFAQKSNVSGYATGDVSGANGFVGGLVGYAGNMTGTQNSAVIGYATGNVSADGNPGNTICIGGLVGLAFNIRVTGYATGKVSGTSSVGGLVGRSYFGTVIGYVRGVVERKSRPRPSNFFGLLVGGGYYGKEKGYHSFTDSKFKGIAPPESRFKGLETEEIERQTEEKDGILLAIDGATEETFDGVLDFGTPAGQWTWVGTGKWPAINLPPEVKGKSAPKDQPLKVATSITRSPAPPLGHNVSINLAGLSVFHKAHKLPEWFMVPTLMINVRKFLSSYQI